MHVEYSNYMNENKAESSILSFILHPCMFSTNILGTASELASWVPVFLLEKKLD